MKIKKIVLSLAGVLATVALVPEASALPVFARQTGMACSACHFQHFPLLNSFGRAFKSSGFTMGGSQANIEGDGLSIPATVNGAILTSMGYEKTNATKGAVPVVNMSAAGASTGGFFVGSESGEASLFVGGRGSDFMGYLGEITLGNGSAAMDSLKTPILFDINGTRAGIVFYSTNGQGASYGFETLNTGANAIHTITNTVGFQNQYVNVVSAQQWLGTATAATGASLVANNEHGFINVTKYAQVGAADAGAVQGALGSSGTFVGLTSTYLRAAGFFDLAGWDSAVGIQNWSGSSVKNTSSGPSVTTTLTGAPVTGATSTYSSGFGAAIEETKATAVDFQTQGTVGDKPVGIYVTYATAPATPAGATTSNTNVFNGGTHTRSSFNVAGEIGVVPEKVTIGAAVRFANSGVDDGTGSNTKDNGIYLTGTYKLAQNLLGRLSIAHNSGSYWNTASPVAGSTNTAGQDFGTNQYTLNLYALF